MEVFIHRTGMMHRMLQIVAKGYHWHISGTVDASAADRFAEKFVCRYGVAKTMRQRQWAKGRGQANAYFFIHPTYRGLAFQWWLLMTDGEHPAKVEQQPLLDARERGQRLSIGEEYEAVLRPRKGGAPAWTWQLTAEAMTEWQTKVSAAIRHSKDSRQLRVVLGQTTRLPGFRGVRNQVLKLRSGAQAEWKRIKAEREPFKAPLKQGFVRFQTYKTVPLAVVRERLLAGLPPIAEGWRTTAPTSSRAPAGAIEQSAGAGG